MNTIPQIEKKKKIPEWAIIPKNTKVSVAMFTSRVLEMNNIQIITGYLPKWVLG